MGFLLGKKPKEVEKKCAAEPIQITSTLESLISMRHKRRNESVGKPSEIVKRKDKKKINESKQNVCRVQEKGPKSSHTRQYVNRP